MRRKCLLFFFACMLEAAHFFAHDECKGVRWVMEFTKPKLFLLYLSPFFSFHISVETNVGRISNLIEDVAFTLFIYIYIYISPYVPLLAFYPFP